MKNKEVFLKDPTSYKIPNDGVTTISNPKTPQEWEVLEYELRTFVCEGSYESGIDRIMTTFMTHLSEPKQPAVWVHGFYGSGKSHLVRVLEYLWRDVELPSGALASSLVHLPADIKAHFTELKTHGKRHGGLWSAAGTLRESAGDNVKLALLAIAFRSAGLPEDYRLANFVIWLKQEGYYEAVKKEVESQGREFSRELRNLYVSSHLANAVLKVYPGLAKNEADARLLFKEMYPKVDDISNDQFLTVLEYVLELQSDTPGKLPLTLLIFDELQQFIGNEVDRATMVQEIVQVCTSRFGSHILFIGTGQTALEADTNLSRLKDRFTVDVFLQDSDVEKVVRKVVLQKAPDKISYLEDKLDKNKAEIDRHLQGTHIGPKAEDEKVLIADYPLLPTRRRFWEKTLPAIDIAGTSALLRTQLRVTHEAVRLVAEDRVGTVVPADVIYWQQESSMLQSGLLLQEVNLMIREMDDDTPKGELKSRLCALIFIIGKLPSEGPSATGLRATKDTLIDLMVKNLKQDRAELDQNIPPLLDELVTDGKLMILENEEYRLQTREGAEWEADYIKRFAEIRNNDTRIASEREDVFRVSISQAVKSLSFTQGKSKTPRKFSLYFGLDYPSSIGENVPVWVRDGWSVSEKNVREDAQAAGLESPIVFVLLPRINSEDLRITLAQYLAAKESVDIRPRPSAAEGYEALQAMKAKRDIAKNKLGRIVHGIINTARVYQGGGNEIATDDLSESIKTAVEASLQRLFPDFSDADHAGWGTVVSRALEGAADCLKAVGFDGDADQHPVCKEIRLFIGNAGKKGKEVRDHFSGAGFGWPRDAIDGALLALLAGGYIRAEMNGQQKSFKEITPRLINQVSFFSEGITISVIQRIGLREIFVKANIPFTIHEETEAIPQLLQELLGLAEEAGGPPPLPKRPNTELIDNLKALSGNERFVAVFDAKDELIDCYQRWLEAKNKKEVREPNWEKLQKLVGYSTSLATYEEVLNQVNAIETHRSLLTDPDPVLPIIDTLTDALRSAVQDAHRNLHEKYHQEMKVLQNSSLWKKLDLEQQERLLSQAGISEPDQLNLGSLDDLLEELEKQPLPTWQDRQDAISIRFEKARMLAARLLEPESVKVIPKSATIKTAEDLETYIGEFRNEVQSHLDEGNPVVISRN